MPASLFIEHRPAGLAFYINGHLQFDSADEVIYHEHLVVPAIALAEQRFPETELRVLICGGGDGLAARDVLRFSAVTDLSLVDYSPEVLELARTTFKPYNRGSLLPEKTALGESRVTLFTQEAFAFVTQLPDACFHAVICDFTSPTTAHETAIYSSEWFTHLRRILHPGGVIAVNGVSPEKTTLGFWCLYQTLLTAGFQPKPMRIPIPSFQSLEYGDWGFFLASDRPIARAELTTLAFPTGLRILKPGEWLTVFRFPAAIAQQRQTAMAHTLTAPQLLYYLFNPTPTAAAPMDSPEWVDFLDILEPGNGLIAKQDALELTTIAQRWLEHLAQIPGTQPEIAPEAWIPVQHHYHEPQMVTESLDYLREFMQEIDAEKLFAALLERAKELPPQIKQELPQFIRRLRSGEALNQLSEQTLKMITILTVVLLVANLATPDAVYAKGFSGGARGISSGGGSSGIDDNYGSSSNGQFGWIGFLMVLTGGWWLLNISSNVNRNDEN
jgi:spermidine synthase